ncbi:MAG: hypothetical protein QGF73_04775 [Acidimicrobiales bacterium]|nr:hypothetical protein [Acidimicrobiales bacterium]
MQSSNNNRSWSVGVVVTRDKAFSCPRTDAAQPAKVRSPPRTEAFADSKRDRSSESEIVFSTWVLVVVGVAVVVVVVAGVVVVVAGGAVVVVGAAVVVVVGAAVVVVVGGVVVGVAVVVVVGAAVVVVAVSELPPQEATKAKQMRIEIFFTSKDHFFF